MRQHARVLDVRDHDLELFGEVGHLAHDVGERLLDVSHQRGELGRVLDDVGELGDLGDEVGLGRDPGVDPDPLTALDQHAKGPVGHADHPCHHADHPDGVEVLGRRDLDLRGATRHHHDRAIAAKHVVDELNAPLLPDVQRDQHVGERDRVAQRQRADALGQARAGAADLDFPRAAVGGADLDQGGFRSVHHVHYGFTS